MTLAKKYYFDLQMKGNALCGVAQQLYQKVRSMSWQECVERGVETGALMALDTLTLNFVGGFASTAGRTAISKVTAAINKADVFNPRVAGEFAGVVKLMANEGQEVVGNAARVVAKNPEIFEEMAASEAISEMITYNGADNIALYPKLKKDLLMKEITSATNATKHGIERLIERGFSSEEIIALKNSPDIVMVQKDGAVVLIKKLNEKYNLMIEGERGVVTSLKNISENALNKLAKNYSWERLKK